MAGKNGANGISNNIADRAMIINYNERLGAMSMQSNELNPLSANNQKPNASGNDNTMSIDIAQTHLWFTHSSALLAFSIPIWLILWFKSGILVLSCGLSIWL